MLTFLSTLKRWKISKQGGRWSKKAKIWSTQLKKAPLLSYVGCTSTHRNGNIFKTRQIVIRCFMILQYVFFLPRFHQNQSQFLASMYLFFLKMRLHSRFELHCARQNKSFQLSRTFRDILRMSFNILIYENFLEALLPNAINVM